VSVGDVGGWNGVESCNNSRGGWLVVTFVWDSETTDVFQSVVGCDFLCGIARQLMFFNR
jgi:hypothetical protein